MKVNSTPGAELLKAYQSQSANRINQSPGETKPAANQAATDTVNMSEKATLFQEIQKGINSAPDVRADQVKAAREQIRNGRYNADLNAVADRLISLDLNARI